MLKPEIFPQSMRDAKRWLAVIASDDNPLNKRPIAPFDRKPEDWPDLTPSGTPARWPTSWNVPQAWGTIQEAIKYIDAHDDAKRLSFVTHNGGSAGLSLASEIV